MTFPGLFQFLPKRWGVWITLQYLNGRVGSGLRCIILRATVYRLINLCMHKLRHLWEGVVWLRGTWPFPLKHLWDSLGKFPNTAMKRDSFVFLLLGVVLQHVFFFNLLACSWHTLIRQMQYMCMHRAQWNSRPNTILIKDPLPLVSLPLTPTPPPPSPGPLFLKLFP